MMVDDARLRAAREAKARFGAQLLGNPDVHGVGIGRRRRGGNKTDEIAIVVHVQQKRPRAEVAPGRLLPQSVRFTNRRGEDIEVPVDVVERPIPTPEVGCGECSNDLETRVRPVPGGYSGGPPLSVSTGGTLGGWLWDNVTDQIVVISNHHVFGGTAGTDITQPSIFDGGSLPADRIADVLRAGTLDASIAAPTDSGVYKLEIECGGPAVYEIADPEIDMVVQKTGQTTGLTCGVVDLVDYDSNHYGSHNDIWVDGDGNDFSMGGDSGSLYLERDHPDGSSWRRVVGIHWGGAGNDGVGHPIRAVFDDLDLTTVCTGLVNSLSRALFRDGEESEEETGSRERRRPRRRSFARDVEARLRETDGGAKLADLLHRHRVEVVKVLSNPDGWRAAVASLAPFAAHAVTTDDFLDHQVNEADVKNLHRLLRVAERLAGDDAAEAIGFAKDLIAASRGRAVRELLR